MLSRLILYTAIVLYRYICTASIATTIVAAVATAIAAAVCHDVSAFAGVATTTVSHRIIASFHRPAAIVVRRYGVFNIKVVDIVIIVISHNRLAFHIRLVPVFGLDGGNNVTTFANRPWIGDQQ